MPVRGIRGATSVDQDNRTEIAQATRELLTTISQANPDLRKEDIASVLFTVTSDLTSDYPARAARELGWVEVPLLCALEIPVPESLPKCIRVLIHWNTKLPQSAVRHVYLRKAAQLRPDLSLDMKGDNLNV